MKYTEQLRKFNGALPYQFDSTEHHLGSIAYNLSITAKLLEEHSRSFIDDYIEGTNNFLTGERIAAETCLQKTEGTAEFHITTAATMALQLAFNFSTPLENLADQIEIPPTLTSGRSAYCMTLELFESLGRIRKAIRIADSYQINHAITTLIRQIEHVAKTTRIPLDNWISLNIYCKIGPITSGAAA